MTLATHNATLNSIRLNPQLRSDFLHELLRANKDNISRIVRNQLGQYDRELIYGEAQQAFMIAADRALTSAREDDDGRGKNSFSAWCAWRGLRGVQDEVRKIAGRHDRPSIKQSIDKNMVYADAVPSSWDGLRSDPANYESMVVSAISVRDFINTLKPKERDVLMLYVFGENEHTKLHCHCEYGSFRHSVTRDVAKTIGYSEEYVAKLLRGLRERAVAFLVA